MVPVQKAHLRARVFFPNYEEGKSWSVEAEQAADKALDDMPEEYGIKAQLMAHRAEVVGMWINEYNEEETMQMFKEEGRQEGRREGIKVGEQRGRQEGENLFAALIKKLTSLGKNEDIIKIADDSEFREELYIQYGLKKPCENISMNMQFR